MELQLALMKNLKPVQENLVFEQEPMQSLVGEKLLSVYQHDGFWQCMDTFRDWQLLNSMIDQEKAPWKVW
jgi:glucose-1-phosphate cytidylyltransferase